MLTICTESVKRIQGSLGYAKAPETDNKVLLISSYHPEYPLVIEETKNAEDILRDKGVGINRLYLDKEWSG
jgi:hypothetical protein